MKKKFLVLILLVTFDHSFAQENTESKIDVKTSIIGQKACLKLGSYIRNGETIEFNHVRVVVELQNQLTNKSDLPMLFDKRGGTVRGYSIYQKRTDTMKGRQMTAVGWGLSRTDEYTTEGDVPSNWFQILKKDETLVLPQVKVRLDFDYPGKYANYNDGEFFIDFSFLTVTGDVPKENDLDEIRRRWSRIGYLWFEDLNTTPVLIYFPNQESLKVCEN